MFPHCIRFEREQTCLLLSLEPCPISRSHAQSLSLPHRNTAHDQYERNKKTKTGDDAIMMMTIIVMMFMINEMMTARLITTMTMIMMMT